MHNEKINEEVLERLIHRARELTYGMMEKCHRLPDYADFRAAFVDELKGGHYGQSSGRDTNRE